jgi:hypothetical protein
VAEAVERQNPDYGVYKAHEWSGGSQTESATAGVQESLSTVGGKQLGARLLA